MKIAFIMPPQLKIINQNIKAKNNKNNLFIKIVLNLLRCHSLMKIILIKIIMKKQRININIINKLDKNQKANNNKWKIIKREEANII